MSDFTIRRGDIFYIDKFGYQVGSEQRSGRPGIIVSCDDNNVNSETVEIVYTTTRYKPELPTHVSILSTPMESTVLCEQVTTVSVERLGNYIGCCTEKEMQEIDIAIMVSLGLSTTERKNTKDDSPQEAVDAHEQEKAQEQEALTAMRAERDTYRRLYEMLVDRLMPKVQGA